MKIFNPLPLLGMGRAKPADTSPASTDSTGIPPTPTANLSDEQIAAVVRKWSEPLRLSAGRLEAPPLPSAPVTMFRGIAGALSGLALTAELETLVSVQAEIDRSKKVVNELTPPAADRAYLDQQTRGEAHARRGEAGPDHNYSQEDYREDYASQAASARCAIAAACREVEPIIEKIADRFRSKSQAVIESLLVADYRNFQKFGVAFEPSLLVKTLSHALVSLQKHLPRDGKQIEPRYIIELFALDRE